jgi:Flp pilus assembly protein TadD
MNYHNGKTSSRLHAQHSSSSSSSKQISAADRDAPPFSKPLTWIDVKARVDSRAYFLMKDGGNKGNSHYHHNLAPLYGEIGDVRNEIKHHRLAVEYNSTSSNALNDYGLALMKAGKLKLAEKQFVQALDFSPGHLLVTKNLAGKSFIFFSLSLHQVVFHSPTSTSSLHYSPSLLLLLLLILLLLLALFARDGRYTKSQEYCEKAIHIDPNDAMAHRNLAKILDTLGNTRGAVKHNRIAIQLGEGVRGGTQYDDTNAYRCLARQVVARGERMEGYAHEHYDQYRALAGKEYVLPNSERTREILKSTGTFV